MSCPIILVFHKDTILWDLKSCLTTTGSRCRFTLWALETVCMCYLLDSLGCDNGGDCASLLNHHSLLMTRIHRLAMQVAGCGFSVRLHKDKLQSDQTDYSVTRDI